MSDVLATIFVDRHGLDEEWGSVSALRELVGELGLSASTEMGPSVVVGGEVVQIEVRWNPDGRPTRRTVDGFLGFPVVFELYQQKNDDELREALVAVETVLSSLAERGARFVTASAYEDQLEASGRNVDLEE